MMSSDAPMTVGSGNGNNSFLSTPDKQQQSMLQSPPPPPEEAGREDQQQQSSSMASPSVASGLTQNAMDAHLNPRSVATLSQAWEYDDMYDNCHRCAVRFTLLERKHHCRYCGKIFCHNCSKDKALIPPSAIVLVPKGGKQVTSKQAQQLQSGVSFSPDEDPDRMLTYVASGGVGGDVNTQQQQQQQQQQGEVLLYGKGLEERFQLAREPLRVCNSCHLTLQPLQAELQRSNSHAMRFNHIDPTDMRRLFNSPLAFTLGHEVRKAAYTLNNLLPQPKRRLGAVVQGDVDAFAYTGTPGIHQQCQEECSTITPTLAQLDGLRIPAKLLEEARGIAVLTVVKGGFGLAGAEFGTGLVVARLGGPGSNTWSAPSAIGTAGLSWGALVGAQISDHVFVCMTDESVRMIMASKGSVQLGADVGVAVGPVGRAVEADYGASPHHVAPVYTYSLSKGLYAGVSLDGKVIVTRHNVNEKFYGRKVSPEEILQGQIPTPPAAQPLYDALTRCQVYTQPNFHARRAAALRASGGVYSNSITNGNGINEGMEYGEWQQQGLVVDGMNQLNLSAAGGGFGAAGSAVMPDNYNNNSAMSPSVGVPGGYNSNNNVSSPSPSMATASDPYNVVTFTIDEDPSPLFQTQPEQQTPPPTTTTTLPPMPQQPPPPPPPSEPQPTIAQLPPLPTEQNPMPPAANDQHSYAGLSDITSDPGY